MNGKSAAAVLSMFVLAGCSHETPRLARAEIRDVSAKTIGTAEFRPSGDNVAVTVRVSGLAPGQHGIHVHEAGKCEAPDFMSAGPHFNPGGEAHHGTDGKHHAGDLPNLVIGADGTGVLEAVLEGITLDGRGHHSLFHYGGTSILIHRDADDLATAPSGNSGDRVACGVIEASR